MRSPRLILALLLAGTACSDSNGLPDPTLTNVETSQTLYALVGTPVATPSGYAVDGNRLIRTDLSVDFDFAYNIESDGRHVLIPRAAMGIDASPNPNPGLLPHTAAFEAITVAPSNGYITDQPIVIALGERYVVRSRIACTIGVPKYGKLEITGFDEAARTVTFRVLIDDNCGFKGLEPGLPKR
jgi:hypothetical protein